MYKMPEREPERDRIISTQKFRLNINCPYCGALIPQYIVHFNGTWDTAEHCNMCGYDRDYDLSNPHGGLK